MYFVSGSCFILTCYETVHCTVSAKFINEFGASCLLCFAQFTPPSKRQKAPKKAWTRCPSLFSQSLRVQQVAPTVSPVGSVGASALCAEVSTGDPHPLQGRQKVSLISGSSKSVSFLGRGEMNEVFIINFVKFIQTRNFFRRGAL